MSGIPNSHIAELALVLANARAPTREEILTAMRLAYEGGKIDGSLETCTKFLQPKEPPA